MAQQTETTALAKKKTYNPVAFKRDFVALASQSPEKAAKMAGNWRERLENALVNAESAAEMSLSMLTLGASNIAFTLLDGYTAEKKRTIERVWAGDATVVMNDELQKVADAKLTYLGTSPSAEQINASSPFKEGNIKDPTKLLFMPTNVWILGVTSGIAWLARNSPQGIVARNIFAGSLTAATGAFGAGAGARLYRKRLENSKK
jgi:hypothetical protein